MSQKLLQKQQPDFSFFLAIPTMLGATLKKSYDYYKAGFGTVAQDQVGLFNYWKCGSIFVALIAIKNFHRFLTKTWF